MLWGVKNRPGKLPSARDVATPPSHAILGILLMTKLNLDHVSDILDINYFFCSPTEPRILGINSNIFSGSNPTSFW